MFLNLLRRCLRYFLVIGLYHSFWLIVLYSLVWYLGITNIDTISNDNIDLMINHKRMILFGSLFIFYLVLECRIRIRYSVPEN